MGVDYRKQYRPDQLEPFWPDELMKMSVAVLCTLAVIMLLVVLPVVLEAAGLEGVVHAEEPADPMGGTPVGIKPEWYFLASYQYLRIMPTELLGVGGKTLGVVTQGLVLLPVLLLPFWYRRRAHRAPGRAYRLTVTALLVAVVVLTIWGGWPEGHGEGSEGAVPLLEYVLHRPLMFIMFAVSLIVFYALIAHERETIRRTLGPPAKEDDREEVGP
jgi:quinol-cytochrome oxidoreductase complex cytochrome b subunit